MQVLPALLSYQKWSSQSHNVQVGDVVLIHYEVKYGKGEYRLARVTQVHPAANNVVRTVTVGLRPRDSREKVSKKAPFLSNKPLEEIKLGVQRLVVVSPVEEQSSVPGVSPEERGPPFKDIAGPPEEVGDYFKEAPSPAEADQLQGQPDLVPAVRRAKGRKRRDWARFGQIRTRSKK